MDNRIAKVVRVVGALLMIVGFIVPVWASVNYGLGQAEQSLYGCAAVGSLFCYSTIQPRSNRAHNFTIALVGGALLLTSLLGAVILQLQEQAIQSWNPFVVNGVTGLFLMVLAKGLAVSSASHQQQQSRREGSARQDN